MCSAMCYRNHTPSWKHGESSPPYRVLIMSSKSHKPLVGCLAPLSSLRIFEMSSVSLEIAVQPPTIVQRGTLLHPPVVVSVKASLMVSMKALTRFGHMPHWSIKVKRIEVGS